MTPSRSSRLRLYYRMEREVFEMLKELNTACRAITEELIGINDRIKKIEKWVNGQMLAELGWEDRLNYP